MRILFHTFSLLALSLSISFYSCKGEDLYENSARSLDSISGALNPKLQEIRNVDTVKLSKALKVYEDYRAFIAQNVNDTVSKEEGDMLQRFYSGGKKLKDFMENRLTLVSRGELVKAQIAKLRADVRVHSVEESVLQQALSREKRGAEELMSETLGQQQEFNSAMEEFRISVTGVENILRARNAGELPNIIQNSEKF